MVKFKVGQRVILKANKREGWMEEKGKVIMVENRGMYLVKVDKTYCSEMDDDGIREVHVSGMKVHS